MTKEGTVAPKERVNIVYRPATGDQREEVELPFKILMLADFLGTHDPRSIEERSPISVDKDNFDKVMAEHALQVDLSVADRLNGDGTGTLDVSLPIRGLKDLTPDGIAQQVPVLAQLLALRGALIALRGPVGNVPAFRRKIQSLLADEEARRRLARELTSGDD